MKQVLKALEMFGLYDDLYSLLNVFEVHPWETWHIEEKVIHAPGKCALNGELISPCTCTHTGPWVTFEIQLPQDDYNLLAWQLGQPLTDPELRATKNAHQLKGLPHEGALVEGQQQSGCHGITCVTMGITCVAMGITWPLAHYQVLSIGRSTWPKTSRRGGGTAVRCYLKAPGGSR